MKTAVFGMISLSVMAVLRPALDTPVAWRHFRAYPDIAEAHRLAKIGAFDAASAHFARALVHDPTNMSAQSGLLYADVALGHWRSVKQRCFPVRAA